MIRSIPKKYLKLYNRAMTGRSRKAAIRSFCIECMGYNEKEIPICTDKGCPLFKYRLRG
jgi:hypothetical protein